MLEEAKKKNKKKPISRQEAIKQFWQNYPVVINPPVPGPNGAVRNVGDSPLPFPQYTQESLNSKIIHKARKESLIKSINESIELIQYNQLNEDLKDLFKDHAYKIINEKSIKPFSVSSFLDLKQKQATYNLIALSAMSALIASRVLTDKKYFQRNQSIQARFSDALQRAVSVAATDPGILSKIKQNARGMNLITTEEIQIMESFKNPNFKSKNTGIPLNIIKEAYDRGVTAYKNGISETKVY